MFLLLALEGAAKIGVGVEVFLSEITNSKEESLLPRVSISVLI